MCAKKESKIKFILKCISGQSFESTKETIISSNLSQDELYSLYVELEKILMDNMQMGVIKDAMLNCRTWAHIGKKLAEYEMDSLKRKQDLDNINSFKNQILGLCRSNDKESLMELHQHYSCLISQYCGGIEGLWEKGCL